MMIDVTLSKIAIMFFLCILAGFVDSIAGGGGLISLTSYYAIGLPPVYALGNNKFSSTFGTLFATINYARMRKIVWSIAIFASIFAVMGSSIGAQLALRFAGRVFKYVMLIVLPILTIITVKNPKLVNDKKRIEGGLGVKQYLFIMLLSISIGVYDGFFGPGTGMFYTIGLSFLGLSLIDACGTTKLINLSSNIAALTTFILNGNIIYKLGIPCVFASIIGNLLGSEFAIKHGKKGIVPILLLVIALLYIKILMDLFI